MDDTQFADIATWISNAGLSGQDETAMVTEFCNRLVALGLPLARAQLFIDTLHPVHAGLGYYWQNASLSGAAKGETVARDVRAEVARAVRRLAASVGVVAASYRNGVIILVAPEVGSTAARELGETLRTAVSKLRLRNSESVVSDYVTASVAAITGKAKQAIDRIHLLTHAIAKVQVAAGSGGDRVLALTL